MFYTMERICENYVHENVLCMVMHMHGAGVHLRCVNNKPANKFQNKFTYGYVKIYRCKKYLLYGTTCT